MNDVTQPENTSHPKRSQWFEKIESQLLRSLGQLRYENAQLVAQVEQLMDQIATLSQENAELLFGKRELEVEVIKLSRSSKAAGRKVQPPRRMACWGSGRLVAGGNR